MGVDNLCRLECERFKKSSSVPISSYWESIVACNSAGVVIMIKKRDNRWLIACKNKVTSSEPRLMLLMYVRAPYIYKRKDIINFNLGRITAWSVTRIEPSCGLVRTGMTYVIAGSQCLS